MATYMVHWITRPDFDRFLETGELPKTGGFAEEMPRSDIDGLSQYEFYRNVIIGLVKHHWYSRNLRAWAGDESALEKAEVCVHSVNWTDDDRVFVVCSFD
jgi:hypothetical protein